MKAKELRMRLGPALAALLLLAGWSAGFSPADKSGDIEGPPSGTEDKITVLAFYPTLGTIRDFLTLRRGKFIDLPQLEVMGVYHEKEKTNYRESKDFVSKNNLDWITFHPISAPISAETAFRTNACTPEFEKLFDRADGVIFFGGPDIQPVLYGEKTSLLTNIQDPYRHFLEVSFIFHLLGGHQDGAFIPLLEKRPDFPVLGICLGCQSLNVGAGGTLTQDIWSEVYGAGTVEDAIALGAAAWHSNPYGLLFPLERFPDIHLHEVRFAEEGRFQREVGWKRKDLPLVLSSHHQQVETLGKGLRVIASSLDGKVVEAIEHERYRHVLGVQFHPESWMLFDPDFQARLTPQDKEPFNLKTYLEGRPPTLTFHRKLWSWVSRAWQEERRRK